MRITMLLAAAAATVVALPALAQDTTTTEAPAPASGSATAPDGTRAFGVEPYFGVMGGWEQFDSEPNKAGIPLVPRSNKLNGSLVQGVVGVNIPLNAFFIGAEGNIAKGVSGDINWEYGAAGRFGLRAGNSGLIYGKVGYQWVNFDKRVDTGPHYHDWTYGIGFEVGPKEIGMGGNGGLRLRGEVSTFGDFHSFRPTLGIITHF